MEEDPTRDSYATAADLEAHLPSDGEHWEEFAAGCVAEALPREAVGFFSNMPRSVFRGETVPCFLSDGRCPKEYGRRPGSWVVEHGEEKGLGNVNPNPTALQCMVNPNPN